MAMFRMEYFFLNGIKVIIYEYAHMIIEYCQARVQVKGLSQISNKRPGPGA